MPMRLCCAFLMLCIVLPAAAARQPDLARERRMADEIVDTILDGEPLQLSATDGQLFLGIYTNSTQAPARGTVIILHGRGFHPDWVDVVQPLRIGLSTHGWNTLSIQMPVLDASAKYFDYVQIFDWAGPRIEAAIATARSTAPGPVVLLAHSCASHMAQHWMNVKGAQAVGQFDAFVGIGMGATDYRQQMVEPFALDKIGGPILDVYAQQDFPAVRRLAPQRQAAMRRGGNPLNRQVVIPDAEHYFADRGEALVDAVSTWLDRALRKP